MRYSLIMPYYKRSLQLSRTLMSFQELYASRADYEVVVLEDSKNSDDVANVCRRFESCVQIKLLRMPGPHVFNPAPAFNRGVQEASGDFIVLTNPECLHKVDILTIFDQEFRKDSRVYVVCACESAREVYMDDSGLSSLRYRHHMWYQHSEHRDVQYHFCCALAKASYERVGGFDERYAHGIGYDDNAFRRSIDTAGIRVVVRDDALTVHQEHAKLTAEIPRAEYHRRLQRNRRLFEQEQSQAVKE